MRGNGEEPRRWLCGQACSTSCRFPSRPDMWALSVLLCSIGMSYTKEHMNSDTVPPVVTLCPIPPWAFPWAHRVLGFTKRQRGHGGQESQRF